MNCCVYVDIILRKGVVVSSSDFQMAPQPLKFNKYCSSGVSLDPKFYENPSSKDRQIFIPEEFNDGVSNLHIVELDKWKRCVSTRQYPTSKLCFQNYLEGLGKTLILNKDIPYADLYSNRIFSTKI
jgi:hypothetical protein